MKIPKTTTEKPYIEFRISSKGKIKLKATSLWWGGKSGGFSSTDGTIGNSCEPKHLEECIRAFGEGRVKEMEKQIKKLQKEFEVVKSAIDSWHF
jgi:hypothetical protein